MFSIPPFGLTDCHSKNDFLVQLCASTAGEKRNFVYFPWFPVKKYRSLKKSVSFLLDNEYVCIYLNKFYDIAEDSLTYTPKHVVIIICILSLKSVNVASTSAFSLFVIYSKTFFHISLLYPKWHCWHKFSFSSYTLSDTNETTSHFPLIS
jgi:hypothetical protein